MGFISGNVLCEWRPTKSKVSGGSSFGCNDGEIQGEATYYVGETCQGTDRKWKDRKTQSQDSEKPTIYR